MSARAFITAVAGPRITSAEAAFLREARPWGLILFKRNIENPDQVTALIDCFRSVVGWRAPVLVDQEGGRVQRLGPPHWPSYPPAAAYGALYQRDSGQAVAAARLGARLIAADLSVLGIDVDCLPVADIPVAGADAVIGDRAYGATPDQVAELAAAAAQGLLAGGVLPVVKHIPGHGRATADSHLRLPVVKTDLATLQATDFVPFRSLRTLPLAMTAHVVFTALDPVAPATTSPAMIQLIRDSIGFDGLLMSDDIAMGALTGSLRQRSAAALDAGCDVVLYCSGRLAEAEQVAAAVPALGGAAERRAEAALAARRPPDLIDTTAARAEFAAVMKESTVPAGTPLR